MRLVRAQGWYYLVGGTWPLVHFRSFEAVAGPKPDRFQTQATAVLFVATGAALLTASAGGGSTAGTRVLAGTSAGALAGLEWRHRRDLRPLFRLEAVVEALFAVAALGSRPDGVRHRTARDGTGWPLPALLPT